MLIFKICVKIVETRSPTCHSVPWRFTCGGLPWAAMIIHADPPPPSFRTGDPSPRHRRPLRPPRAAGGRLPGCRARCRRRWCGVWRRGRRPDSRLGTGFGPVVHVGGGPDAVVTNFCVIFFDGPPSSYFFSAPPLTELHYRHHDIGAR